ncbi:hypothetical protein D9M71_690870 [compost metagenome]
MKGEALPDVLLMPASGGCGHAVVLRQGGRSGKHWPQKCRCSRTKELARPPGWLLFAQVAHEHAQLGNDFGILGHVGISSLDWQIL